MARLESTTWVILILVGALFPLTIYVPILQQIYNYGENRRWEKVSTHVDVPLQQNVVIERVGEWVNITLGDSVFTLLMSEYGGDKWGHVILGILSTMLFHTLYFYSGGQISANHNKTKNMRQLALVGLLSMAWLGISISYKTGLTTNHYLLSEVEPLEGMTVEGREQEEGNSPVTVLDLFNIGVLSKYDATIIIETTEKVKSGSFVGKIIPEEDEGEEHIFPVQYQRGINQAYFTCLCSSILILEVIFWSSNIQYRQARKKIFSLEGSAAVSRKCFFWVLYLLKIACVFTVLVCGLTVEKMHILDPTSTYLIGFSLLTTATLIRLAVRRMLDNAIAESD